MFSISLVVLTIGFWLKVAVVRNSNRDINITFNRTTLDTFSLYCQIFHPTTWKKPNDNIATFLIPKKNLECLRKKCVKLHIIGSITSTDTKIPPYLTSFCAAKYIPSQDLDQFLQDSENWPENFTSGKNLITLSVDNGSGKVTCSGNQEYFDMYDNNISFQVGGEESFVAIITERENKNGMVTLRANLRHNDAPVLNLRQVKCKMCLKQGTGANISDMLFQSKILIGFCVMLLFLKEIIR